MKGTDKRQLEQYLIEEYNYIDDPIVSGNIEQMCKELDQIGKNLKISITFSTKKPTSNKRFPKITYFKNDRNYEKELHLYLDRVTNKIFPVTDINAYETYVKCETCPYKTSDKQNMKDHKKCEVCTKTIKIEAVQKEVGVVTDYIQNLIKGDINSLHYISIFDMTLYHFILYHYDISL